MNNILYTALRLIFTGYCVLCPVCPFYFVIGFNSYIFSVELGYQLSCTTSAASLLLALQSARIGICAVVGQLRFPLWILNLRSQTLITFRSPLFAAPPSQFLQPLSNIAAPY